MIPARQTVMHAEALHSDDRLVEMRQGRIQSAEDTAPPRPPAGPR